MSDPVCRRLRGVLFLGMLAICAVGCDDGDDEGQITSARIETNRICAIVPARDAAAAAFPPTPPVRAFGTDLGWTYERDGVIQILFGDTWQRIDICPIQTNDDSLGTLEWPDDDWRGYTTSDSIPDEECPEVTFALDEAGTSFGPIELRRWDGVLVPLGPLNTPVTGFYDGEREWAIFIIGGGQNCDAAGAACPDRLSPQAVDLECAPVGDGESCVDPTSTKSGDSSQALYLHVAERIDATRYVSRAMFLTNKYLNLTSRAVHAFDPDSGDIDYSEGTGALLMWGRPGFNDLAREGVSPPYFMYHALPFEIVGDRIAFAPRYFTGYGVDGEPAYANSQRDAVPLYADEFEPVNHAGVSWIEPLQRWMTIYGGSVVDYQDPDGISGESQPVSGALYARFAPDAWGPWTDAQVAMTEEVVAEDMACGTRHPVGCTANPADPPVRPQCISIFDEDSGGSLYGVNIIDQYTRAGDGRSADVFWLLSTWNPYAVVLVKSHVELD